MINSEISWKKCLKWEEKIMKRNRNKYKVMKFSLKKQESAIIKNISCRKKILKSHHWSPTLLAYLHIIISLTVRTFARPSLSVSKFWSIEIPVFPKGLRQDLR